MCILFVVLGICSNIFAKVKNEHKNDFFKNHLYFYSLAKKTLNIELHLHKTESISSKIRNRTRVPTLSTHNQYVLEA
jgi:hypothetical protein